MPQDGVHLHPEAPRDGANGDRTGALLVEEVDCGKQLFRRLKAYRHGDNNLEGPTQALGFTEAAWTVPEPDTFDATIVRDACL